MSIPSRVKGAIPVNIMKKVWSKKSRILVASMITFGVISIGEFTSDSPYPSTNLFSPALLGSLICQPKSVC